jgi:hypothetical protein
MDNIDRFQIIKPKAFPPFILEKTLASVDTYQKCFPYIKWVGQVFSCTETIDGVDRKVECIYCVVWPDRNLPLAAGTRVSIEDDYIASYPFNSKGLQIQNYGGELLFDIPNDYYGKECYFCLVKRKSIDPSINIPYYDGSEEPTFLTANTFNDSITYSWKPVLPPINIEDCIEGMAITGDRVLNFSAVLEDPHYNDFQSKGYNDFFANGMEYWNNFGEISYTNFLSTPAFAPYGLDMKKGIVVNAVANYQNYWGLDDVEFDYTLIYTFFSPVLNQSHTLKLFRSFALTTFGMNPGIAASDNAGLEINTDFALSNIYFDNTRIVPISWEPSSTFAWQKFTFSMSTHTIFSNSFSSGRTYAVSNIFSFNASDNWVITSISAIRTCPTVPELLQYFADSLPNFDHVTAQNVEQFKAAYGYLMSGFKLEQN